VSKNL
jgi:hypothetical protein